MPIKDEVAWNNYVEKNTDDYGSVCVKVAREAFILLDEQQEFNTHQLICAAGDRAKTDGIMGFMAGCVAQMISECHSRGEEFRRKWNIDNQIQDEGTQANETPSFVLNPALLCIEVKEEGD